MKNDKVVRTDKDTKKQLVIWAAQREVAIGTVLKELVDAKKAKEEKK
jgi:hypothetical protein